MWFTLISMCVALILFILSVMGIFVGTGVYSKREVVRNITDDMHTAPGHYDYADDEKQYDYEYYYERERVSY